MNLRSMMATIVAAAVIAACGGSKNESGGTGTGTGTGTGAGTAAVGKDGAKAKWLAAAWKPTEVDLDGVKVTVDVPDGLPANDDFMLGKDWWIGANAEPPGLPAGPRLTLYRPKEKTFDAESLARDVEPDASRADLVEVAKETLPDGRVRYVSAVKGNSHLDVTVWIPLADGTRGIRCNGHWWAGSGREEPRTPPPPDTAILDWLKRFCDSVQVAAAPAAPAQ